MIRTADMATCLTFLASHLIHFCILLLGGFSLLVVTNETLDVEGVKESNVPWPVVIPAASVICTFDLLPLGVKINLVTLGKEPSGVEEVEDEDV